MFNIDYQDEIAKRLGSLSPNGNPGIAGGVAMTQGGPASDPRWTNGTWGTGPTVPGVQPDAGAPLKQNASDPRSFIQSTLGKYQYGPQGLLSAEKDFTDAGYRIQKDSGGLARGRIYDPSGRQWDVFDPTEGRTAQDNWNTSMRGKNWSLNDMGMPSAGGSAPSTGGNFQTGIASLLSGDPLAAIQGALGQYTGQSDYLKALLEQLGQ